MTRISLFVGLALGVSVVAAAAEPVTVAALGDSLTQGYGLAQDDGLVPQLQAWLRGQGADVTIVNAGVSGDTTAGGLSRIDWTLADRPDGIIVALGGNDMLRGFDPELTRSNLDAILTRAEDAGVPALLIGLQAMGNYGPDYKAAFDAIFPELALRHRVPVVESMLAPIMDDPTPQRLIQPDGIHPNGEGVARIVAAIGPRVLEFVEGLGACPEGCTAP